LKFEVILDFGHSVRKKTIIKLTLSLDERLPKSLFYRYLMRLKIIHLSQC